MIHLAQTLGRNKQIEILQNSENLSQFFVVKAVFEHFKLVFCCLDFCSSFIFDYSRKESFSFPNVQFFKTLSFCQKCNFHSILIFIFLKLNIIADLTLTNMHFI